MQKLLIEVNQQDQIFVENECTNKGETLSSFFEKLLQGYKDRGNNFIDCKSTDLSSDGATDEKKPKRGRKKKTPASIEENPTENQKVIENE